MGAAIISWAFTACLALIASLNIPSGALFVSVVGSAIGSTISTKLPSLLVFVALLTKFIDTMTQLIKDSCIQPSTEPWTALVMVAKKKGGALRFCVDYRQLNSQTVPNMFPMPDVKETLDGPC
jgi:hypothetical protein